MEFSYILEQIISGVVLGCSYALVGVGLSMIWGILKMININHGELYMSGAYFMWVSFTMGMPLVVAAIIGLVCTLLLSALIQTATIRPLFKKPGWNSSPFILTMALSILMQNVALRVFGEKFQNIPYFDDGIYKIFGNINISGQRIYIVVVTVLVVALLMVIIRFTRLGRAIRATAQERDAARLMGVNTARIYLVTYVISGVLAAIAGILLAPIYSVNPWMGSAVQIKGLVVCVLAGLGSIEGAIGAGIILGLAESLSVTFIDSTWKDIVSYLILVVILWVKPNGLFMKKGEA